MKYGTHHSTVELTIELLCSPESLHLNYQLQSTIHLMLGLGGVHLFSAAASKQNHIQASYIRKHTKQTIKRGSQYNDQKSKQKMKSALPQELAYC